MWARPKVPADVTQGKANIAFQMIDIDYVQGKYYS